MCSFIFVHSSWARFIKPSLSMSPKDVQPGKQSNDSFGKEYVRYG